MARDLRHNPLVLVLVLVLEDDRKIEDEDEDEDEDGDYHPLTPLLANPPVGCSHTPMQTAESLRATWRRAGNDSRRLPQTAVPRDFVFARDWWNAHRQTFRPEAPQKLNRTRPESLSVGVP